MSSTWQITIGLSVPILTLVGAIVTALFARRSAQDVSAVGLLEQVKEWTELRLKERDDRIDRLENEVRELRSELDELLTKYRAAIGYIRQLVAQLRRHVAPEDITPPPEEIQIDI